MKRRGVVARPHGFRSSLRDWIAETTNTSYEVAEATLRHIVGGKVERAYRRTDYLEQRRDLLGHWARHVTRIRGPVDSPILLDANACGSSRQYVATYFVPRSEHASWDVEFLVELINLRSRQARLIKARGPHPFYETARHRSRFP